MAVKLTDLHSLALCNSRARSRSAISLSNGIATRSGFLSQRRHNDRLWFAILLAPAVPLSSAASSYERTRQYANQAPTTAFDQSLISRGDVNNINSAPKPNSQRAPLMTLRAQRSDRTGFSGAGFSSVFCIGQLPLFTRELFIYILDTWLKILARARIVINERNASSSIFDPPGTKICHTSRHHILHIFWI